MSFYPLSPRIYRQCKYLHLPMKDEDDITPHIPSITTFVSSALRPANPTTNNNVLIHCVSGINRSAAAIITYLCHVKPKFGVVDAFMHLWEKKTNVCPRRRFLEQIERWFGRSRKGDKKAKGHRRGDISRECCDRVDQKRLEWMNNGKYERGVDWLWMQQGHGFTLEGKKDRFWEKGEGKVGEFKDAKSREEACALALRKLSVYEAEARKKFAANFPSAEK
ncbi:uncharacterized protein PAC_04780 [Phialocephala subalpina]|uniref:protein-tyrosine-phosphatase n=1 Tax=Phialocephala subalpina TaxID=576137 RepID=A0A1L7WQ46_9HELO|nr:uncharacterized protein PAC_04780 [Phialocephala subalpina]